MTTIAVERIQQSNPNPATNEVAHGAHIRCQLDAKRVTALCGALLDWDDEQPATPTMCVVCRDLATCPLCGAPVRLPA